MKRILITGGAGFIGSHLCEHLLMLGGYEITSLDNYSSGTPANHIKGVNYISGETEHIGKLINFDPDMVFHLGEYSRVEQSFDDLEIVYRSNKIGTFRVIEFCRLKGSKLIYAGSSTKFGDGTLGRNQSPYAWSKASNTELIINYGSWFSLPYVIAYFYNAYGPREIEDGKYATLIGIYSKRMRHNQCLQVVEPGIQHRNFTHVKDIVTGVVLAGELGNGDEYGIGCKDSYSILDVAHMFGGSIEMIPQRPGNRMMAEVITEKIEKLGWHPTYKLDDYIARIKDNHFNPLI